MQSILDNKSVEGVVKRIDTLLPDDKRLWGRMTAGEMICHAADQIKMATGNIKTEFGGNLLSTTLLKKFVLWGMPAPKGKVETVKELKQGAGGTKPTTFDEDRESLKSLVLTFADKYPSDEEIVHPAFGKMTKNEWGKLCFIHLDYHLMQFGK